MCIHFVEEEGDETVNEAIENVVSFFPDESVRLDEVK